MTAPTKPRRPRPTWVDDVAVERAIKGEKVGRPLTEAERRSAARHVYDRGGGPKAIRLTCKVDATKAAELLAYCRRRRPARRSARTRPAGGGLR